MGEGAAIYNCLLCDSYALVVLGVLPDRKLARGLKGKAAYDDLLEAFQLEFAGSSETVRLLACPTCNAFARQSGDAPSPAPAAAPTAAPPPPPPPILAGDQLEHGEFLRDALAVLTPSRLVSFDEGEPPPVYRNDAAPEAKPKWRLTQGVGPPGLELDKSRTGRLHKPSLRAFGVDARPLALPPSLAGGGDALSDATRTAAAFAERCVVGGFGDFGDARSDATEGEATVSRWREEACEGRPVLERWDAARAHAEAVMGPEAFRAMAEEATGGERKRLDRYEAMRRAETSSAARGGAPTRRGVEVSDEFDSLTSRGGRRRARE
jgi:hypothetical protein